MSGQPETANQRYYAAESLRTGQSRLMELSQQLVVQRCQVESYRASDLAAARDTYSQLQQTRKDLVAILADIRMLLMEVEETQLAAMAGQLQTGLRRFSLMSNTYRPVYDVLRDLAGKLPVEGKANAAVIGRLMNHVRLGHYPTDPAHVALLAQGIAFPAGIKANILDPCCGTGNFLLQLPDSIAPEQIFGFDIDAVSIFIARINMALKFPHTPVSGIRAQIRLQDFLLDEDSRRYH